MSLTYINAVNQLEELRVSGERQSSKVVEIGHFLLDKDRYISSLGDEVWIIYEQVVVACLDIGELLFAKDLLLRLGQRFPDSMRFSRLCGMTLEAEGKFEDALALYENILDENETHIPTLKRKIAINITLGKFKDAVQGLLEYLDINPMDKEAWIQLANLYIDNNMIEQASHCIEELIMDDPQNHIYHLKYAEILYTLEHFHLALKSYCRVVELCDNHIRGFYGIKQCVPKLLESKEPKDTKLLKDLDALATKQLVTSYSKNDSPSKLKVILERFLVH